ncbi:MAG: MFS transporter [Oscillospiraceae bacterium]|nr:MFS transporter [Oscillospiraceae bacterium]
MKQSNIRVRWLYLSLGGIALLFAGVIYAWSILKAPLAEEFNWTGAQLALNFTLTMCFFCLGGFVGGLLGKRIGCRLSLLLAAILAGLGFFLASRLKGQLSLLYLSYGVMAGLGIGIAYNTIISTVSAWFPDRKGLCSGVLMMGFGASALVVGKLATALMEGPGWRSAYLTLGICLAAVLSLTALALRRPGNEVSLPQPALKRSGAAEDFPQQDYTTGEMLRRPSFWLAFLCIVSLSAVGSTVISFARDLSLSVGAEASLATTLVGVLSICNGLGRIVTGVLFDRAGRKTTMLLANLLTIFAAGISLLAVQVGSLPLCVLGLCLTGLSYGTSPTISSAFTSAFYGAKHFSMNFSVMNFNLILASFVATAAGSLSESTGAYIVPFLLLLGLSVLSLGLNLGIKKP